MLLIRTFAYQLLILLGSCLMVSNVALSSPIPETKRAEIDSLVKILPFSTTDIKVNILLAISNEYLSYSMDTSRDYAERALITAKEINNLGTIAEVYKLLGNIYYRQGKYTEVIVYYDSSLLNFQMINDTDGMAKVWNNLGLIYQKFGDIKQSIDFNFKSLDYKIAVNDSVGITGSYNNIGSLYFDLADYDKSYFFFSKAFYIAEQLNNKQLMESILNNLGLVLQEQKDYIKSLEYFRRSLNIGKQINYPEAMANTYHNLGKSCFELSEFQESLNYYFKALKIYKKLGVDQAPTLNNIGQVYIELDYYQQALKYLYEALLFAKEGNDIKMLRDIYKNLSVTHEIMGNYKDAHNNYKLFNLYDDSLKNEILSNKLDEFHTKREIEKKQEEIEKINLANQIEIQNKDFAIRKRNYVIYSTITGFVAILIIALVLLRLFRLKANANKNLRARNEEILKSDETIKNINKALTESEEMIRSTFDASPYAICVIDSSGLILDCNNSAIKMFEQTDKTDLIAKDFNNFFIDEQKETAKENFRKVYSNGNLSTRQFVMITKTGGTFNAEISGGIIKDSAGSSKAYVAIITDITERLNFIENLNQAKQAAEESDRLKTAFLANMSHEIRTPMNSIVGFSNLLIETGLENEKRDEYLKHILRSSNLLLNLIDDIIDISKIEAGQLSVSVFESKINPVINEVYAVFNDANKNPDVKLRLKLPSDSDVSSFKTDPLRLRQILSNLIGNALKFTEKGFIEIGYLIHSQAANPNVEFYVKDTGIGIPKDKHELIFERFRQVDDGRTRRYGGTGLGLAISKRLVEMLGGTIRVESEPGSGSTFYFNLPYSTDKRFEEENFEQFNVLKYAWNNKTILIAEDENSNYELVKATIGRTHVKVIRAFNGEEAVKIVKNGNPIDLVLMDIRMPKMNGYEATGLIKNIFPNLPVIAFTAYAMSEDESKSLKAGCDLYISKPIRPVKLLNIIDRYLSPVKS